MQFFKWYIVDWQIYWPSWWKLIPYYGEVYDSDFDVTGFVFAFGVFQAIGYAD